MRLTVVPALILGMFVASAASAEVDHEAIKDRINSLVPDAGDIFVSETQIPDVMEVRVGSDILYMSQDGRYLLQGRLFDLETQTDLTDKARTSLRQASMEGIDEFEMISFSPGDPEYEVYVFTDIDCGYCRRMHAEIDEYMEQGIAIHYLMFPRAGAGSPTWQTSESVWCADDQQEAITVAKLGQDVEEQTCDAPIESQYEFGQKVGVTGTPAKLTADGVLIPGYVQPRQLKERLDELNSED